MIKITSKKKIVKIQQQKTPLLVMQKYLNQMKNKNNPCLKNIKPSLISRQKSSQSVKKTDQPLHLKYKKYNNLTINDSPFNITKKQICEKKKTFVSQCSTFEFQNLFAKIKHPKNVIFLAEKKKLVTLPTVATPHDQQPNLKEDGRTQKIETNQQKPKKKIIYHSKYRPQTSLHKYQYLERREKDQGMIKKHKMVNKDVSFSELTDFKAWDVESIENILPI